MADIDALPADQRATLQLLLKQGQGYGEIASLLGIDEAAVRRRALDALDSLGPESGRRIAPELRADVADYLLSQQPASQRENTRDALRDSAGARAWARGVAGELRPLAADALPEIPDEGVAAAVAEDDRDGDRLAPYAQGPGDARPASKLGGALLLGGLALIVTVVVILLVSGGSDDKGSTNRADTLSSTPSTNTQTTKQGQSRPVAQINLFSPGGGRSTVGLAQLFAMGTRRALVVAGQGLAPGTYALWLYNSRTDSKLLGFVPQPVGKNGRFATQGELPKDGARFKQLVVTRENISRGTKTVPKQPGTIVLAGKLVVK